MDKLSIIQDLTDGLGLLDNVLETMDDYSLRDASPIVRDIKGIIKDAREWIEKH